jgi:hypothetical protein
MQIVVPDGASYVTQSEFNTSIALLACSQNKIGKKEFFFFFFLLSGGI